MELQSELQHYPRVALTRSKSFGIEFGCQDSSLSATWDLESGSWIIELGYIEKLGVDR